MIPRYSDLAANERTYLAWMRTALAMIAFGFLMERFDLMLRTLGSAIDHGKLAHGSPVGRESGIVMITLGLGVMILSSFRFVKTTRLIRSEDSEKYCLRNVLVTGGIFILLAVFVLAYIIRVSS